MFMLKHKYGAKRTEIDCIKFDSKIEAKYYQALKLHQKSGSLLFFLRQTPFHLPGGIKYVCDFTEFWAPTKDDQGSVVFTDVKGYDTPVSKLKRKQVEDLYGIKINIVTKA